MPHPPPHLQPLYCRDHMHNWLRSWKPDAAMPFGCCYCWRCWCCCRSVARINVVASSQAVNMDTQIASIARSFSVSLSHSLIHIAERETVWWNYEQQLYRIVRTVDGCSTFIVRSVADSAVATRVLNAICSFDVAASSHASDILAVVI